jgi:hypothetical protein
MTRGQSPGEFCVVSSFTTRPSMRAGSNGVGIEIGEMVEQCLDRRIPDKKTLVRESGLGATPQRRTGPHQMAHHRRAGTGENGSSLPRPVQLRLGRSRLKSNTFTVSRY